MTRYPSGPSSDLVGGWLKQTHNSFYKYSAATSFNSNLGMDHPKSNYKVKLKLSGLTVMHFGHRTMQNWSDLATDNSKVVCVFICVSV